MGDKMSRGVAVGRTQPPPICVPSELFSVYQPVIGPVAAMVWLNMRWAAHEGAAFDVDDTERFGDYLSSHEIDDAVQQLIEYGLVEEDGQGGWIVHDPLPREVFDLRYGDVSPGAVQERTRSEAPAAGREPKRRPSTKADKSQKPQTSPVKVMRSPLSKERTRARMLKLVDEHAQDEGPINEDMQAVVQIYHKRIGMIGPTQYERLRFWVEEQGMQGAVVALAIEETVASADVPRISYLEGILRNWYNDGIRTLAHIQESKRASKVLAGSTASPSASRGNEGAPNASAYQSVDPDLVEKWKELYPDEYDG